MENNNNININPISIAHKLYDIISDGLDSGKIQSDEDIIPILETEKSQITGRIKGVEDEYSLVFVDQSVLQIKITDSDDGGDPWIDLKHGFYISKSQVN